MGAPRKTVLGGGRKKEESGMKDDEGEKGINTQKRKKIGKEEGRK